MKKEATGMVKGRIFFSCRTIIIVDKCKNSEKLENFLFLKTGNNLSGIRLNFP
jgi:hypothetical protein